MGSHAAGTVVRPVRSSYNTENRDGAVRDRQVRQRTSVTSVAERAQAEGDGGRFGQRAHGGRLAARLVAPRVAGPWLRPKHGRRLLSGEQGHWRREMCNRKQSTQGVRDLPGGMWANLTYSSKWSPLAWTKSPSGIVFRPDP